MDQDDPVAILDDQQILRRVVPTHLEATKDRTAWKRTPDGHIKYRSRCFADSSDGTPMSCRLDTPEDRARLLQEVEEGERGRCALVAFSAADARVAGLRLFHDDPLDPSHVAVAGITTESRAEIKKHALVVVEPELPPQGPES